MEMNAPHSTIFRLGEQKLVEKLENNKDNQVLNYNYAICIFRKRMVYNWVWGNFLEAGDW